MKNTKARFTSNKVAIVEQKNYSVFCAHGPCLLFERTKRGSSEADKFYACSIYRSRKYCNFYLPEALAKKRHAEEKNAAPEDNTLAIKRSYAQLKTIRKLPSEKRCFCSTCQQLIQHEETPLHNGHKLEWGITNIQLRNPTKLIIPETHKDKEAQYWFSKGSLKLLIEMIERENFDGVLCIGTPRLFETLNGSLYKKKFKSFLLDYDIRLAQFWSPRFFAQFNMIANYFYNKLGQKHLNAFFDSTSRLALIVDPPFGALCCQVAKMMQTLRSQFVELKGCNKECSSEKNVACHCIWTSPYFLQPKITENWSELNMLDFQVEYENHPLYKKTNTNKNQASPIRIFTTLNPSSIVLPQNKYKFCKKCDCYSLKTNKHCDICQKCPSKDGRPYVHCKVCKKCVKSTYAHCQSCSTCHLKGNCYSPASVADDEVILETHPRPKRAKI